jgi:hypothetical protein
MKNHCLFLLTIINVQAQEVAKTVLKFDCKGTISLTNPATTSNGLVVVPSNIAGNFGLNYDLNYKRRCSLGQ